MPVHDLICDLMISHARSTHTCTHPHTNDEQIPPGELALQAAGEKWDKLYKKTRRMCLHEARGTVRVGRDRTASRRVKTFSLWLAL